MPPIEETIVQLVKQFDAMDTPERQAPAGMEIVAQLQLIGSTAAFFGGYEGMKKLHDAAEKLVGKDNSVGYHLNRIWDGVGSWMA